MIRIKSFFIPISLILLAFLIRFDILATTPRLVLSSDNAIYMGLARKLFEGDFWGFIHAWWAPLFPLTAYFMHYAVMDWGLTGRAVSIVFGSLLVLPIYLLGKTILGPTTGFIAAIIVAFSGPLIDSSIESLAEPEAIFFVWLGFYLSYVGLSQKNKLKSFLAGLCWGLAGLTKNEETILFGSLFLVSLGWIIFQKSAKKILMISLAYTVIGFIIIYSPFQLLLQMKYHQAIIYTKLSSLTNLYNSYELNKDKTTVYAQDIFSIDTYNINSEYNHGFYQKLQIYYRSWIGDTFFRIGFGTRNYIMPSLTDLGFYLALVGTLWIIFNPRKKLVMLLVITIILGLFGEMFFAPDSEIRYNYWLIPAYALGISLMAKFNILKTILSLFVIYLIFFTTAFYSPIYLKNIFSLSAPHATILNQDAWLVKNDPSQRVLMRYEAYGFYSHSLVIYTPFFQNLADLNTYAHAKKAKYLVVDPGQIDHNFDYLYNNPQDYPGFKLILTGKKNNGQLYQIL